MLKRNLVHTAAVFLHICTSECCLQITAHKIKQIEPHYFRHHTENECALTSRKGLSSQTSKANSELFIDTKCSSSSIQQVKQIHSPIQTRLKAQGNLKLVTTNVRLNSSSYYLRGERERESGPKSSKEEQHSELRDKKKNPAEGSERGDFSHLHKVLHFIYIFVLIIYVL